jgi:hypothetical protein
MEPRYPRPPTLKVYDDKIQIPLGLEATEWPQFYKVTGKISWREDLHPLLNKGNAYIKDPPLESRLPCSGPRGR